MDYYRQTKRQFLTTLCLLLLASNLVLLAAWLALTNLMHLSGTLTIAVLVIAAIAIAIGGAFIIANHLLSPLRAIWSFIMHLTPHGGEQLAQPDLNHLSIGRQLVTHLTEQVISLAATNSLVPAAKGDVDFVANNLPLPLFMLDNEETIVFANTQAGEYVGINSSELIGKNFYMVMDMAFPSENTLDHWLKKVKNSTATASSSWERVKLNVLDNHPTRLFDLAAYYNQNNPHHYETLLVLFDHTSQYSQDDQAVSFVALSVHELRTPLTILRGYIEALQDEMGTTGSPQIKEFLQKMNATAQQLTAFVNNILNVARVDNDQLQLSLHEENWADVLNSAVNSIRLRATVRGINLKTNIAPDLPNVGVDRLSIYEVISNIIDNALKYSGDGKEIVIDAHLSKDGMVETTILDHGVGISPAIMPNLFTKFYRDHKNRAQIGGTGLGLYLSKAIISAHGGNIWVRSKMGQGSIFGFSVKPFNQLAEEQKSNDNNEITRGAHGWIKNHSLYRR